jgi:hypothetical protein
LLVATLFAAGLFVYRARTLYITGPFLLVALLIAVMLSWVRKLKR